MNKAKIENKSVIIDREQIFSYTVVMPRLCGLDELPG
jgi:hypothetical protein